MASVVSFSSYKQIKYKIMIKTNELRIGNRITYAGKEIIIEGIVRNTIHHSKGQFDQNIAPAYEPFKGITLTEEWLLKIGFKKSPANNSYFMSIPKIKSEIHFEFFRGDFVCVFYSSTGSFIPSEIKFVHELQNLFRSNTGEELVFSTTEP